MYEKELANRYLRDYIAISCTRIIAESLVHDPYMSLSVTEGKVAVDSSSDIESNSSGNSESINLYLVPKIGLESSSGSKSNLSQNIDLNLNPNKFEKYCKVGFMSEIVHGILKVNLDIKVGDTERYFSEIHFREMEIEKILMRI